MAATATQRRRRAASRAEAKARREKMIVIAGLVLLGVVCAFQLPKILHSGGSSGGGGATTTTAAAPAIASPAAKAASHRIPRSLRSSGDPFAAKAFVDGDSQVGGETGRHDPFAVTGASASAASAAVPPAARPATPAAPAATSLPAQIVLGTPGANRHATHGWIVILASIPTAQGRGAAQRFASHASKLGSVQILNSSNRRPLRGGYWVVYTGPYSSLSQVSRHADAVHAAGYGGAYVRELVVYR